MDTSKANATATFAAPAVLSLANDDTSSGSGAENSAEDGFDSYTLVIAASFVVFVLMVARCCHKKQRGRPVLAMVPAPEKAIIVV